MEIFYRAWDEANRVMHYDVEFIRSGVEGNDWIIFKSDKQTLQSGNVLNNPYFSQQIKLMPGIELSGKKYFVGDYVKESNLSIIYLVVLGNYDNYVGFGLQKIESRGENSAYNRLNDAIAPLIKIIGNIYENPELDN